MADRAIDLPADLLPGTHTLQTAWYHSVIGAGVPVSGGTGPHHDAAAQLHQLVASKR